MCTSAMIHVPTRQPAVDLVQSERTAPTPIYFYCNILDAVKRSSRITHSCEINWHGGGLGGRAATWQLDLHYHLE